MPNSHNPDDDLKGSELRLWQLVAQRRRPGADTAAIDARIWDLFGETWSVMFTDLAGFSRQVAKFGIIHFLQVIHEQKEILLPVVAASDGILIKVEADSFMIIFKRPQRAVECALQMQRVCATANLGRAPEDQLLLCVGIGYGRILRIGDSDVWGTEVNAASKLGEDVAKATEILVSQAVRDRLVECGDYPGSAFSPIDGDFPGASGAFALRYTP